MLRFITVVFFITFYQNLYSQNKILDSIIAQENKKKYDLIFSQPKIVIDSCQQKFIKSILNDIYYGKQGWIVVKFANLNKTWNEIVSSKIFYDIYLNSFKESYKDTALKNYNGYMISTELRYFGNNTLDAENSKNLIYNKTKKDTAQYNKLSKQGLQTVLKKYFDKKQQLHDKYKPIQMQIFWYLFDNRVRVVTPKTGKSYYILYDCATTFFPKASYAAYF